MAAFKQSLLAHFSVASRLIFLPQQVSYCGSAGFRYLLASFSVWSSCFTNSSGDLSELVQSGLARLGCTISLDQFESALKKLSLGEQIVSRDARIDALEGFLRNEIDPFDPETEVLQALPEDFFRCALDDLASKYEAGHV